MPIKKKARKTVAKATRKVATKRSAPKPVRAQKTSARPNRSASTSTSARTLQLTSQAPSLTVDDIAQSLAWYSDVLGFTVKDRWEHPEGNLVGGELQAGPVTIYLGRDDWKKGRDRTKGEGVRIYWYTNQDIDALAAGIKSRGGTLSTEPKDEWGSRSFTIDDPTGYKITISSGR
jgi:uncharacterized glyoxalase superfamily protein PhnB